MTVRSEERLSRAMRSARSKGGRAESDGARHEPFCACAGSVRTSLQLNISELRRWGPVPLSGVLYIPIVPSRPNMHFRERSHAYGISRGFRGFSGNDARLAAPRAVEASLCGRFPESTAEDRRLQTGARGPPRATSRIARDLRGLTPTRCGDTGYVVVVLRITTGISRTTPRRGPSARGPSSRSNSNRAQVSPSSTMG